MQAVQITLLLGFVSLSLALGFTHQVDAIEQPRGTRQESSELLNATDLLVLRNWGYSTTIHAQLRVACEVIEFCRVLVPLPSIRILSVDFSGLERKIRHRILERCVPGPCDLGLSGSFTGDEIYVQSVDADEGF